MTQHSADERGEVNPLLIISVVLTVLVLGLGAFGAWAYTNYTDQKDNVDQKISVAVTAAKQQQTSVDQAQFDQQEKLPTLKFTGPADLGSVQLNYPKTWSVYVDKDGSNGTYEAYFNPGVVPPLNSNTPYALRITITGTSYENALANLQEPIRRGQLKSSPVTLGSQTGVRVDGNFSSSVSGSMVLFKVRDTTLEVYTQSPSFASDFNTIVLPSLTFSK